MCGVRARGATGTGRFRVGRDRRRGRGLRLAQADERGRAPERHDEHPDSRHDAPSDVDPTPGTGPLRRRRGLRKHVQCRREGGRLESADEPVAPSRYGLDVAGRVRMVAERGAQPADGAVQRGIELDDAARPEALLELLAGDHLAGTLEQGLEHLLWLRRKVDSCAVTDELARRAHQCPAVKTPLMGLIHRTDLRSDLTPRGARGRATRLCSRLASVHRDGRGQESVMHRSADFHGSGAGAGGIGATGRPSAVRSDFRANTIRTFRRNLS